MIIMNKKELPKCSVEITLSLISNKWKILIIRDLLDGTKRFGELRKSINGISNKVLTYNLREMEEDNLLIRKIYPEVPPRVEYFLTEKGKKLIPVLDIMEEFGNFYVEEYIKNKSKFNEQQHNETNPFNHLCPRGGCDHAGTRYRWQAVAHPLETEIVHTGDTVGQCSLAAHLSNA